MICRLCGTANKWFLARRFHKPDKYEAYAGIEPPICRSWLRCLSCGLYQSRATYDTAKLVKLYENGYRNEDFRGQTIRETFYNIYELPLSKSENKQRFNWFAGAARENPSYILDIGSGLGVWPALLKDHGFRVECVEINEQSIEFIQEELDIPCLYEIPEYGKFDAVSCIHVLEHIGDPESFLKDIAGILKVGGQLFLEVPDAAVFNLLPDDHDDLNSMHFYFFDTATLYQMVEYARFMVNDISRIQNARGAYRIMMLAEKC